jgi:hypothetical protein
MQFSSTKKKPTTFRDAIRAGTAQTGAPKKLKAASSQHKINQIL